MAYINKMACDVMANGWCDQLGKNPKNYLFVALLSLFFNYAIPACAYAMILLFENRDAVFGPTIVLLSPVLPGIMTIYLSSVSVVTIVLFIIIVIIDAVYLAYMARQLGVFVLIPVAIEVARLAIIVFLPDWILLAVKLSMFPAMTAAVGLHFGVYLVSRGVVLKQL
jgi:hypothetical protein